MKIISPYRNIKQYTRISIEPHQMNSDIRNNMKLNLKKKVEKKCNKNGYVDEVYRILEYSDGIMIPENLNSNAVYNITYHCRICIPVENTIILGLVKVINSELIVAMNGPIMFFIPKENIDTNIWDIHDGYVHKQSNRKLISGDYIMIQIVDKRINQNDSQIKSIGKLIDFSTLEDVEKYYGNTAKQQIIESKTKYDNEEVVGESTESNFII